MTYGEVSLDLLRRTLNVTMDNNRSVLWLVNHFNRGVNVRISLLLAETLQFMLLCVAGVRAILGLKALISAGRKAETSYADRERRPYGYR